MGPTRAQVQDMLAALRADLSITDQSETNITNLVSQWLDSNYPSLDPFSKERILDDLNSYEGF